MPYQSWLPVVPYAVVAPQSVLTDILLVEDESTLDDVTDGVLDDGADMDMREVALLRNAAGERPAPRHRRAQRGVEFLVQDADGFERSFRSYNDAAGFAVGVAAATGKPILLDVLVMSRDGAAERVQITAKSAARAR